jgi:hypothetical protein
MLGNIGSDEQPLQVRLSRRTMWERLHCRFRDSPHAAPANLFCV